MSDKEKKTDAEWRAALTPPQFAVMRRKMTGAPFSGEYEHMTAAGTYQCICCGETLFESDAKFDAGCGWPSVTAPAVESRIAEEVDRSHGMMRTEVLCAKCDAHLGHVFDDGPGPMGLQYCINAAVLKHKPSDGDETGGSL